MDSAPRGCVPYSSVSSVVQLEKAHLALAGCRSVWMPKTARDITKSSPGKPDSDRVSQPVRERQSQSLKSESESVRASQYYKPQYCKPYSSVSSVVQFENAHLALAGCRSVWRPKVARGITKSSPGKPDSVRVSQHEPELKSESESVRASQYYKPHFNCSS